MCEPGVQLRLGILRALMERDRMNISHISRLLLLAIGLYVIAVGAAVCASLPAHGSENTIKEIGGWVSVATGIFAPTISILSALIASSSARELERLKATEFEVDKARVTGEVEAFRVVLNAAYFFNFAIRKQVFRSTEGDAELGKEADRRAAEASSFVWYLPEAVGDLWFEVYQRSICLQDDIRGQPEEKRRKVFEQHAQELGAAIKKLERAGSAAIGKPPAQAQVA
jgi:hypothetical protein